MENTVHLQEIIGTDNKKNRFFSVCKHPDQPGKLWVYFGAVLLETIEDDRNHPTFKMLVESLTRAFGVPYSTLRRWGQTVKSGDTEQLIRLFAGRTHPRKLTSEIKSFAKQRFIDIYPDNKYSYSHQIRNEIQDVFEVSISGETLRAPFKEWKKSLDKNTSVETVTIRAQATQHLTPDTHQQGSNKEDENNHLLGIVDDESPLSKAVAPHNRKHVVTLPIAPDYQFCHHAGLLLFSGFLNQFKAVLGESGQWIKQWIAMILLGATNIEQSKLLGKEALRTLLGPFVANLHQQRQVLGELAVTDCLAKLLRLNGEWVGIDRCHDFYYDPHSKHYTGAHKTLKGWCSLLRFTEKVLHMDFIHTAMGFPVYIHHDDNYYDLRERYFEVVKAFRQRFDPGAVYETSVGGVAVGRRTPSEQAILFVIGALGAVAVGVVAIGSGDSAIGSDLAQAAGEVVLVGIGRGHALDRFCLGRDSTQVIPDIAGIH